jgi:leucyl-tRNA synthetase
LDTFVDSSWYYLRYTDPHNEEAIFDKKKMAHWMPVDLYVIGAEHAVLHLLYSRFITKFLHDEGCLGFTEPFKKLRHLGLILGADGQKMSKSRGNVVNPDELVAEFGADAVRLYEMFMGPFEEGQPWDPKGVIGTERFLKRVWKFIASASDEGKKIKTAPASSETYRMPDELKRLLHKTIKKIEEDIEALHFNTAVSALMILLNEAEKISPAVGLPRSFHETFLKLLHPFAPHLAQELWSQLGHGTFLDFEPWPEYDEKLMIDEEIQLIVQVNGKVRDTVKVSADISEAEAKKIALASERVARALGGIVPKKTIFIPGKLINLVV